ncbi:MAG: hypothetical protein IT379_16845 [Deltaproteobacteria bacterium]|nr:hypothetical protein [Deltaproteobacteria bacterium]
MTTTLAMAGPISLRTNLPELEVLFDRAPRVAALHVRDMLGRWFGSHFRVWRRGLNRWQRRMADRGAYQYRTWPANEARSQTDLRAKLARVATFRLDGIYGRGVIRSSAVLAHEIGASVSPTRSRFLRIPVGPWARGKSKKELRRLWPTMLAGAFVRRGRRGLVIVRPTGGKTASGRDRLQTIALLRRQVTIPPTLRVAETWHAQEPERTRRQLEAAQRIVAELATMTKGVRDGV